MHYRVKRKDEQQLDRRRQALGLPDTVPLLPESPADVRSAALITFGDARAFEKARSVSRDAIQKGSIFSRRAVAAGQQGVAAAMASARKRAAVRAGLPALGGPSSEGSGGLPRVVAVQRRGGTAPPQILTIERRDRGSLSRLSKPAGVITAPGAADRGLSVDPVLGASVACSIRLNPAVGGVGGPDVVRRRSDTAASQLAAKRRRLEFGVKLRLTEPLRR